MPTFPPPASRPTISRFAIAAALLLTLPAHAADPAVERARAELDRGAGSAAVLLLKERLSKDPGDAEARLLLGEAYLRAEDYLAAEKEFSRAAEMATAPASWQPGLIAALLGQGRLDEAEAELAAADPAASASPRGRLLQARLALARGNPDAAEAGFRALLAADEEQAEARLGLLQIAGTHGGVAGPEGDLDAFLRDFPNYTSGLLLAADRARAKGQMAQAREFYARALAGAPENLNALAGLVAADLALGAFPAAEESLNRLVQLRPNMPMTWYLSGLSAFLQGQFQAALDPLNQVIAAAPGDPRSRLLVAAIEYQKGNYHAAAEHLQVAVKAQPDNLQARRLLAAALLKDNEPREAIRVLEAAGPEAPPDLIGLLGTAWLTVGERDRGLQLMRQAAERADPRTASLIHVQIAQLTAATGRPDDALIDLEAAAAIPDRSPLADLALIGGQIRAGRLDDAETAAANLEQANPTDPMAADVTGLVAALQGDATKARAQFEQALKIDPNYLPAEVNLARVDIAETQFDAAAARLQKVLAREPEQVDALLLLADLAGLRGDPAAVGDWLNRAVTAAPKAGAPRRRLIDWLIAQDRAAEALPHAEALVSADPRNLVSLQLLARVQGLAGNREALVRTIQLIESTQIDDADWFFAAGMLKLGLGDLAGAQESFGRAIQRKPDHVRARLNLARVQQMAGDADGAMRQATGLQQDFPTAPVGFQLAGQLLLASNRPADAVKPLTEALAIDPTQRDTVLLLADATRRTGNQAQAQTVLDAWLQDHPTDGEVAIQLSLLRQADGDPTGAIAALEPAWRAGSKDPMLLNNLAWLMGQAHDPRALEVAAHAYELQPADATVADTYGWLLHQAGDDARALEVLTGAHNAVPDQPSIAYHLAVVLAATGRGNEARVLLRETLLQSKSFDEVTEARSLLAQLDAGPR